MSQQGYFDSTNLESF